MRLVFLLAILVVVSCVSGDPMRATDDGAGSQSSLAAGKFRGFDLNGQQRICSAMSPTTMCTAVFTPEDQFASDCRAAGHQAFQCDCHDYLCSEKLKR